MQHQIREIPLHCIAQIIGDEEEGFGLGRAAAPGKPDGAVKRPTLQCQELDAGFGFCSTSCVEAWKEGETQPGSHHLVQGIEARAFKIMEHVSAKFITDRLHLLVESVPLLKC